MKKSLKWILAFFLLVGGIGYYGYKKVFNYASEKMVDELTQQVLTKEETKKLMNDPDMQKLIKQQNAAEVPKNTTGTNSNHEPGLVPSKTNTSVNSITGADSKILAFHSREEAMKFMLSKFSLSEIKDFAAMASGGISSEEKAQIKAKLMSRLSPEEYQALKVFGLSELNKQK